MTKEVPLDNRYLIFHVGGEVYGTPLLDVREVVEYLPPKFMPNMEPHFSGVINIRGVVVGVVDLRIRFGKPSEISKKTALLVCETEFGVIAAIVDQVSSVTVVSEGDIDRKPPVVAAVAQDYLLGVAKLKERLVTLVNLKHSIRDMKIVQIAA